METRFINERLSDFIFSLERSTVVKFTRISDLLVIHGYNLEMPYSRRLDNNLYEIRVRGTQELRVFYCFLDNEVWFVHAIIKRTMKIPRSDLLLAQKRVSLLTKR